MASQREILDLQEKIEQHAIDFGLTFDKIIFEMVDWETINMLAAYDGFPVRYPHWRFGMDYERLSKSYAYGLHRISEMVINTIPVYAYLLSSNKMVDQKIVMAHVCGHADFFKNNLWFSNTNRKMLDEMASHASRIRRYMDKYGQDEVEEFIDMCLSIDNLIDIYRTERIEDSDKHKSDNDNNMEDDGSCDDGVKKFSANEYMDRFINPPDLIKKQRLEREEKRKKIEKKFPIFPERDVMLFILQHAPLKNWQRDVMDIIREETYYFTPQRQTKIMNEGWASYIHSRLMTEYIMDSSEIVDYADHHSAVMYAGRNLNPYKLGLELFRDIEERWDRGMFGKEWDECDNIMEKDNWDKKVGLGKEKVFEVRKIYNDIGFIDEFFTEDFVRRAKLFTYKKRDSVGDYIITSKQIDDIKMVLLQKLTNSGTPIVDVVDGNYENKGEMLLKHRYEDQEIDKIRAVETLKFIQKLWGRPVHLQLEKERLSVSN